MSRINVCLFVIKYLSWMCHELSKARSYHFVPAFWNLSKGGPEIVEGCDSCSMPQFCTIIVLAFISGVELFDYVSWGGGIKPSGRHDPASAVKPIISFFIFPKMSQTYSKLDRGIWAKPSNAWVFLTMTMKNDAVSLQKALIFVFMQKIVIIPHFFWNTTKMFQTGYFWYFGHT